MCVYFGPIKVWLLETRRMRFDLAEQLQEAWVQNFTCLIARLNSFCWIFIRIRLSFLLQDLSFQPSLSSGGSSRPILDWPGIAHTAQSSSKVIIWGIHFEEKTIQACNPIIMQFIDVQYLYIGIPGP